MKLLHIIILILLLSVTIISNSIGESKILASNYDSIGLIINVREKYGPTFLDTGNVLFEHNSDLVLSTKNGIKSIYPKANYSITIVRR